MSREPYREHRETQSAKALAAEELVDGLVSEYADRLGRGEDPGRAELLERAGEHAPALERCLAVLEELEGARSAGPGLGGPGLGGPGSLAPGSLGPGSLGPGSLGPGLVLGDFRLGPVLGRGGMAVVYEAEQLSLGRKVALKVLRQHLTLDERSLQRFEREARAAAKLRHEHVVPIHAVGQVDGHAFIAFELVERKTDGGGATLAELIESLADLGREPLPQDLARLSGCSELAQAPSFTSGCIQLLKGVFAAVDHAHGAGVIHRDLKPSNVLLTAAGKPLVADFGLAKDMGEVSFSLTGETLGTPHYMSPEQAQSVNDPVDARTDVYSLGVIAYELLTLKRPFEGGTLAQLMARITTESPRSPHELAPRVPEAVADVVLKALEKHRRARYETVSEFADDLEFALAGRATSAQQAHGVAALFGRIFYSEVSGAPLEYRSRWTIFGLPWIHVARRVRDPRTGEPVWAKGVLAFGDYAIGLYAAGQVAIGFLAVGLIACGPVALGGISLGWVAIGGLAFGWTVTGLFSAGRSGAAAISGWLVEPSQHLQVHDGAGSPLFSAEGTPDALLVSLIGVVFCFTLIPGMWRPLASDEAERQALDRITRYWMPACFSIPFVLAVAGVELPFMANLLIMIGVSLFFGSIVRHRLTGSGPTNPPR